MREYTGENNLHIDGRNIPYQLFTAYHYLQVKHNFTEEEVYEFQEKHFELYQKINQIIALKQSCVLLRHTSYSCGSLTDDLYSLKNELIRYIDDEFAYEFDEELMENYPSKEEYNKLR